MTFSGKVAILPCTSVGQVVGTIARQAAYRVCEDERPDDTVLLFVLEARKGKGLKIRRDARGHFTEPELAIVELVTEAVAAKGDRLCEEAKE